MRRRILKEHWVNVSCLPGTWTYFFFSTAPECDTVLIWFSPHFEDRNGVIVIRLLYLDSIDVQQRWHSISSHSEVQVNRTVMGVFTQSSEASWSLDVVLSLPEQAIRSKMRVSSLHRQGTVLRGGLGASRSLILWTVENPPKLIHWWAASIAGQLSRANVGISQQTQVVE